MLTLDGLAEDAGGKGVLGPSEVEVGGGSDAATDGARPEVDDKKVETSCPFAFHDRALE